MDGDQIYMPEGDSSRAGWLAERMEIPWGRGDGGNYVASVIPTGFAGYARILHPAVDHSGQEVTWGTVARHFHRQAHAEMQWHAITGTPVRGSVPGFHPPEEGNLPAKQRCVLIDLLRRFTGTPDSCWFAVWEGWGALDKWRWPGAVRFELPGRGYILLRGPVEAAANSVEMGPRNQCPSLWWPSDRAWCVATEIDFMWTYVGWSRDCIEAILEDERLESWETSPDHRGDYRGDRVNPWDEKR